jgi:hypothetical protein
VISCYRLTVAKPLTLEQAANLSIDALTSDATYPGAQ